MILVGSMKDKKTIIWVAIFTVVVIAIVVGNYFYNEYVYFEKSLICTYNSQYTNYEETLRFNYVDNTLYDYEREEIMRPSKENSLEELKEFFEAEKEKVKDALNDNFSYTIEEQEDSLKIKTHIITIFNEDFYNSYIESKNISMSSSIDEVMSALKDEYTCEIIKVH